MTDKKQVGIRIDADLKRQFKEDVERRRGRWQGVAGEELENAIRQYLAAPDGARDGASGVDLDTRLARIEAAVGVNATDGGTDTQTDPIHAPAPSERPDSTAATEKKVTWLAGCVKSDLGADFTEVPRWKLKDMVADEYGFKDETESRYVDKLVEYFGLVEHPSADLLVTPERREEVLDAQRDDTRDEARDTLDKL